jgi:hypothetical protein
VTKSSAANLSLVLVALGAITIVMRIAASHVDPGPVAAMPDPRAALRWFGAGLLVLLVGCWLAGFAYSTAKIRSIAALSIGSLLPMIGTLGFWW